MKCSSADAVALRSGNKQSCVCVLCVCVCVFFVSIYRAIQLCVFAERVGGGREDSWRSCG